MTHESETLASLNGSFIKMMEWNRDKFEEMFKKAHEEQLRFVSKRLERTGRALESLRECQGISGLIATEQQWIVDTARDYFENAERFGGIFRELAQKNADETSQGVQSAQADFRKAARGDAEKARETSRQAAAE
jgi:hypothetical protein